MKNLKTIPLVICFSALIILNSCERSSRELGGVSAKQAGSNTENVEAHVSAVPGPAYVQAVAPGGAAAGPSGETLYAQNCSACHQISGNGLPGAFPPLNKSPYVVSDNTERMAAILVYGLSGPINVLGTQYNSVMPPLVSLKDEELAAIATYIRSAWDNKADAVTPDVFAAARTKWGSRSMFTIQELGEES